MTKLKIRWADFTTLTRQTTLGQPINLDREIFAEAVRLFEKTWPSGKRVRLIGVGASHFETPARQLGLWDGSSFEVEQRLQETLDALRERYGCGAIEPGSQLKE